MDFNLTESEKKLVGLVVQGLTNAKIGEQLGLTEGTVTAYLNTVYNKTRQRGRVKLTAWAIKEGLVKV